MHPEEKYRSRKNKSFSSQKAVIFLRKNFRTSTLHFSVAEQIFLTQKIFCYAAVKALTDSENGAYLFIA